MGGLPHKVLDTPACPLVGLALDPRTRYTFANVGHRCHAARPSRGIEPDRQSTYCLSLNFTACERHLAWQRRMDGSG